MAKYDFRILLESVQGVKTSYMSSSFVDTGVDLVLSASQVYNRITGSVSCSYQNSRIFTGTFGSSSFVDNNILSASLTGSLSEGAIIFNSTNTEYDRLKRYKFFGEKVCGTLGLPENQWIFVDQFRLAADDEDNFFEGNVNARNLYVSEDLSFANNSTINSDIPIFIDTGSDRHIKFIDERTTGDVPLFIGYDKDLDFYEIGGSTTKTLVISDVNRLQVSEISHSAHVHASPVGVDLCHELQIEGSAPALKMVEFDETDDGGVNPDTSFFLNNHKLTISNGTNSADGDIEIRTQGFSDAIYIKNSADSVGINEDNPQSTLDVDGDLRVQSHITCSGNIKLDGTIFANEYHTTFTSASIIHASGSTIFGDTVDDIHNFTGSVNITGSTVFDIGARSITIGPISNGTLADISSDSGLFLQYDSGNDIQAGARLIPSSTGTKDLGASTRFWRNFSANSMTASANISASGTITSPIFKTSGLTTNRNGMYEENGRLTISSSNDIIIDTADDIFFQSEGTNVVQIKGDEAQLEVMGEVSASGAVSASIVQAKTFKSEKIFSFLNPVSDGTKYYFPIGAHYIQSTVAPAIVNPSNAFSMTAMCDLSIKRIKIQFAFGAVTVGTSFKMYCRKYNGSGAIDSDSQFVDVGTAWTVTTSNIADNDRFFHAPSDWNISAGDIWGIQYQLNGNDGLVWFNGGLAIEENWNKIISS